MHLPGSALVLFAANPTAWLTPIWLIGLGCLLGLVVLAVLYGLAKLILPGRGRNRCRNLERRFYLSCHLHRRGVRRLHAALAVAASRRCGLFAAQRYLSVVDTAAAARIPSARNLPFPRFPKQSAGRSRKSSNSIFGQMKFARSKLVPTRIWNFICAIPILLRSD